MTTKTTDELDRMIDEALDAEERELLNQIGEEPSYFSQAMGVFDGKLGWVSWTIMLVQAALFFGGIYTAVQFFSATDTLEAMRWGLPTVVLMISAVVLKTTLWPSIQSNRVLRELKRVELQIARARIHD